MKKIITLTAALFCISLLSIAQDFKINKNSGKLSIFLSGATIEGYNGNEIIVSNTSARDDEDERAKGLRVISGSGLEDNTGLGVNVTEKGGAVEIRQVGRKDPNKIVIKVPKGVTVFFQHDKVMNHSKVKLKNIENEIEVSCTYNDIELDNVTGPMTIKTIYGQIDAELGNTVKGPISIVSVYGRVDVTMPTTLKANMSLSTPYGDIYAASDFKFDIEKTEEMVRYGSNSVKGKLNGGGTDISLKSNWGKIYLRKK
jgi:hypothetical protein